MFMFPALLAIMANPIVTRNNDGTLRGRVDILWLCVGFALATLIGFRYQVGGDWRGYLRNFNIAENQSWSEYDTHETSHWVLNKIMSELGWGITGVNVVYGIIFAVGLVIFVRTLPRPWLALAAAVPYLITVVGMGYSRQATALGFVFLGITSLRRGKIASPVIWTCIAATFHVSAGLLVPIMALTVKRNFLQTLAILASIALSSLLLYEILLAERLDRFVYIYVELELADSEGALIRLTMNACAALVYLYYRKRFNLAPTERRLWSLLALGAVAMWLAYFATNLSTPLDRIALYFIPLQLVTAAYLPDAFRNNKSSQIGGIFLVLSVFCLVQFIWLNYAHHANFWIPFQMGIAQ